MDKKKLFLFTKLVRSRRQDISLGFVVVVVVLNIFAFLWTIINIITVATDSDDPMKAVQTAQDTSFLLFITILRFYI